MLIPTIWQMWKEEWYTEIVVEGLVTKIFICHLELWFFFIRSHNLTILTFSHLEPEQCNSLIEVLQAGVKPLLNVYSMCSEEYWLDSRACVNYVLFLAFILFSSFLLGLLCWVSILVKVHQRNETRDFIIVPGCLKFREIGVFVTPYYI